MKTIAGMIGNLWCNYLGQTVEVEYWQDNDKKSQKCVLVNISKDKEFIEIKTEYKDIEKIYFLGVNYDCWRSGIAEGIIRIKQENKLIYWNKILTNIHAFDKYGIQLLREMIKTFEILADNNMPLWAVLKETEIKENEIYLAAKGIVCNAPGKAGMPRFVESTNHGFKLSEVWNIIDIVEMFEPVIASQIRDGLVFKFDSLMKDLNLTKLDKNYSIKKEDEDGEDEEQQN